jgi:peptidyl-prolyl cis-trans isomerase SurA
MLMTKSFFSLLLIVFLMVPVASSAKIFDQVAGVIDGEVITLSDLDAAMPQYGKANLPDAENPLDREIRLREVRKEILEMLVEERLLQRVANRYGIKVGDEEIDMLITKMKQEGQIDDATLARQLKENGFTLEGYRHFLVAQVRRARIIDALIKPDIAMSEPKLREYYQAHYESYSAPEVRVSQILILVPEKAQPKDWAIAKQRMEKVVERLKKGATFEQVATLYSDDKPSAAAGGDLGFFTKGEMIPQLEEAVFRLNVGAVTNVIRSTQGLYLLKVTEKRGGSTLSFDEAKNRVMEDYYREEVTKRYTKWLSDLKARSNVEIKL